jgi:hypothetical protein
VIKTDILFFYVEKKKRNRFTYVWFNKKLSKYFGQFTHEQKRYYCGSHLNESEAAQAVNAKCVELSIPLKNPEAGLPENTPKVRFIYVYFFFFRFF